MVLREKILVRLLLVVAMLSTFLVQTLAAQKSSASVQLAYSLGKRLKPIDLSHSGVQIAPFPSNQLDWSLAKTQHALMSAPRPGIPSALANANLPLTSPKRFSLPGVSSTNFLVPTIVRPTAWKYFNLPGTNASELRSDKHPDLADTR